MRTQPSTELLGCTEVTFTTNGDIRRPGRGWGPVLDEGLPVEGLQRQIGELGLYREPNRN